MLWGDDLAMLYNDAYAPILGSKHPAAMGTPVRRVWPEIWDTVGPLMRQAQAGQSIWAEDQRLVVERAGFSEEAYFTFSYSPITDDDGHVQGIFAAVSETTAQVVRDRRLRLVGRLSDRARDIGSEDGGAAAALEVLTESRADVPFAALYLVDGDEACLDAVASLDPALRGTRHTLDVDAPWELGKVVADGPRLVSCPDWIVPSLVSGDPPCRQAYVQPLRDSASSPVSSVLVTALHPQRPWDAEYRGFLDLVGGQLSRALADARASRQERERAAALDELNRAKTEFFSNVSHEFRTPLTLLLQPLADVLADAELPDVHREPLVVVRRNADRLTKLVNTLLDFSRIEAGRAGASFVATDLATVSADLASVFRAAIVQAGLDFRIDTTPLPRPVYVDRDSWEKILFNLLSNALKYTFEGSITVRLTDDGDAPCSRSVTPASGSPPTRCRACSSASTGSAAAAPAATRAPASGSPWCASSPACTAVTSRRTAPRA